MEGAVAEGATALLAAVASDFRGDRSVVNTVVGESGVTRWGSVKVGTGRVRTVGKKS